MEMTEVPQVDNSRPVQNPDAQAMALTGNTAVDLANVARELGVTLDASGNVAESQPAAQPAAVTPPQEPARPQAAPEQPQVTSDKPAETVEVPQKFQNPDGTPNVDKIDKSTMSLTERIAKFKALEREHSQLQNKANNPPAAPQPVVPQTNAQLSPLEYQMAQDLLNEAAAQGVALDQRLAIAQARVMARGLEAKHAAERSITEDLRREVNEQRMTAELSDLLEADPSLATPEAANRVIAIKAEQGFKTYREAVVHYFGEQALAQRTGQVRTPTPTGQTAKAPPTPVSPVTRVHKTVDLNNPKTLSDADLEAQARKLFPGLRFGSRL